MTGRWHFLELLYCIGTCQFSENGGNAGDIMDMVVWKCVTDVLEGRAKFAAIFCTGGEFYVGQEDKGKLCIINGDAVGVHPSNFSSQKLHVGVYLLLEVEFECEYGG